MIITLFESISKAYTTKEQIINSSWDDIVDLLCEFNQANNKEDVNLFNLWEFNPLGESGRKYIYEDNAKTQNFKTIPGTIRRCKENAIGCWGIVLDYDQESNIIDACNELKDYEFVLYTSYRHQPDKHKFRIILPFDQMCERHIFKKKINSIQEKFKNCDPASFSESQAFYLHSALDNTNALSYRNKGKFISLMDFADEVEKDIIPELKKVTDFKGNKEEAQERYKELLIESLLTCSGLHYAGTKTKQGVLTLVALCKSAGMTFLDFNPICWSIAAIDSSLKDESTRKSVWNSWVPFSGITAKTRDEFIAAYNGKSKFRVKVIIRH